MPNPKKKILLKSKKKQARDWRKNQHFVGSDGIKTSHRMAWVGDPSKKKGNFGVFPTVAPKKGKESSKKESDWTSQSPKQAESKGEMINFKKRKKAEKFAAGSWKKGSAKRQAMKSYRKTKRK